MNLSVKEYFEIANELRDSHSLFYIMWEMGAPVFSEAIPTAGVSVGNDRRNRIDFIFNPNFWKSLSKEGKKFVICHECLHVMLNHCFRIKDSKNKMACNIFLDVVVNHMLVDKFGFNREEIDKEIIPIFQKLFKDKEAKPCWVDNIFKGNNYPTDESFEFYYNKGKHKIQSIYLIDSHDGLADNGESEKIIKDVVNRMSEEEFQEIKETLKKNISTKQKAGNKQGDEKMTILIKDPPPKRKWETVIKNWYLKANSLYKPDTNWVKKNRRFSTLNSNLLLPSYQAKEEQEKNKIEVWFFQDTSGSCIYLAERFFKAAKSIPKNRFRIRMFCFDTKIYETSLETGKLYGFGGTAFDIIETYIQKEAKEKYPRAVFVVTDGYGNHVHPKHPERWHWFLSTNFNDYISKDCNIYNLEDFE